MHRSLQLTTLALTAAVVAVGATGFSSATFTSRTTNTAMVQAAPDWTPPTVTWASPGPDAVVSGTTTLTVSAADEKSGIASLQMEYKPTAGSVWSSVCTLTTAGPTYSCSWNTTAMGVSDGAYRLRAIATDKVTPKGYTAESVIAVTVKNTATPPVTGLGSISGQPNGDGMVSNGDRLTLTYARQVDLATVATAWTGAPLPVQVELTRGNGTGADTVLQVYTSDAARQAVYLGTVHLNGAYIVPNRSVVFGASMSATTSPGPTAVTVTLGNPVSGDRFLTAVTGGINMTWVPSHTAKYSDGESVLAIAVTETDSDRDF